MRPSTLFSLAGLVLGLGCVGLFLWLRRDSLPETPATIQAPAPVERRNPPAKVRSALILTAQINPDVAAMIAALERALAGGDARPQEAVLAFKDDAALREFLQRAQKAGLVVTGQLEALRTVRVKFESFDALREELAGHASDYTAVDANNLIRVPSAPPKEDRAAVNQVPFGNETLAFLGATGDRSNWGSGTTIAILDTGVAADATFGHGRLRALDIGLGLTPGSGRQDGHGTGVAALAAGSAADAAGLAPAASILSIRVTDATGTSDLFTISHAIVAAVDAGAKIINISLGGYATNATLDSALGYALKQGALVIAAAGNDQAAQLAWPAADPRVVSVGAVDRAEQQVTFSNSSLQLQLSAPGYGVQTAWLNGQRVYVDGTSASSPIVAGAIAALISRNPAMTPQQAATLLASTANDTGQPGADAAFGRGILNVGTAMNSANPGYVDTAVASHFYDPSTHQMQFVVQNRSGRAVSGLTLNVSTGPTVTSFPVPLLAAGQTYVAKVPVHEAAIKSAGSLRFWTELTNPLGLIDQVPANNKRASILAPPGP